MGSYLDIHTVGSNDVGATSVFGTRGKGIVVGARVVLSIMPILILRGVFVLIVVQSCSNKIYIHGTMRLNELRKVGP